MLIENNLNTYANIAGTSISATILNINVKNYEINKEILKISKAMLDSKNLNDNIFLDILEVLGSIKEMQKEILATLKEK